MDQNAAITKVSIVVAFVKFDYWFLYTVVGIGGRSHDRGVFRDTWSITIMRASIRE